MNQEEDFIIFESDIRDYFFKKLVDAGLCPEGGDIEVISNIVMDYLMDIGVMDPDSIVYVDEEDEEEE